MTPPAATAPATTPEATTTAAGGETIQKLVISKDLKTKPAIAKPSGDPPTKLYSRDIVKGKGKKAESGDNVSVQYVGVSYSNGEQFDASWDRASRFSSSSARRWSSPAGIRASPACARAAGGCSSSRRISATARAGRARSRRTRR